MRKKEAKKPPAMGQTVSTTRAKEKKGEAGRGGGELTVAGPIRGLLLIKYGGHPLTLQGKRKTVFRRRKKAERVEDIREEMYRFQTPTPQQPKGDPLREGAGRWIIRWGRQGVS